jgi:hypothetical protein
MASLRPALKHGSEIYAASLNGQHLDALPEHLAATFRRQALNGEDISEYVFGFVNDGGKFLTREDATARALKAGLITSDEAASAMLTSEVCVWCRCLKHSNCMCSGFRSDGDKQKGAPLRAPRVACHVPAATLPRRPHAWLGQHRRGAARSTPL